MVSTVPCKVESGLPTQELIEAHLDDNRETILSFCGNSFSHNLAPWNHNLWGLRERARTCRCVWGLHAWSAVTKHCPLRARMEAPGGVLIDRSM